MREITMEERQYLYTELVFLDENNEILYTDRRNDDLWYDTVESRPATEDEMNDYGLWGSDDE